MKKFISMVMAAAMVTSLVPATAFAYEIASDVRVIDALELTEDQADKVPYVGFVATDKDGNSMDGTVYDVPELQIEITDDAYTATDVAPYKYELTLKLNNAEFVADLMGVETKFYDSAFASMVGYKEEGTGSVGSFTKVTVSDQDEDEVTLTLEGVQLDEDDEIIIKLWSKLTKTSAGAEAKVTVDSDDLGLDNVEKVYATIQDNVLELDVEDMTDVAEEVVTEVEEITIEAATGYLPAGKTGDDGEDLKLKLPSSFVFANVGDIQFKVKGTGSVAVDTKDGKPNVDDNVLYLNVTGNVEKVELTKVQIEADTAKAGDVCTLTVTATDWEKASVEIATVVGEGLSISVDADEDVPEMWSGVLPQSKYLTDDCDNEALTITIKESVAASFDETDKLELVLPEGVWVVGATANTVEGDPATANNWDNLLKAAYQKGDHQSFEFGKRTIKETVKEAYEIELDLVLVADPGFVGDVTVEMLVDGESKGEVTVATFKAPIIVEAEQNDLKIDYRNTEIGSDIVVKEAEAGLWSNALSMGFVIDKFDADDFEDDMVYTVNEDASGMEIDGKDDYLFFEIDEESDDEAGEVVISNISLYMDRNLAAGAYDLKMYGDCFTEYKMAELFAPDCGDSYNTTWDAVNNKWVVCTTAGHECIIDDVADISGVVKEAFINIVTAGREQDDASFTTKVVVPVGESYIVAGEQTVALDVPAYVSAAGYTMLPVRAVATALGINNNNVLWDQATKTVTILYGQRIITMTVGAKVINVNGSAIPASASVEVVNGRTFLPMRDLATALGVTDITWDAATKTATLNGNI